MLHFILQTIAFQLFFLIVYDAFLKKETFFNWNRAYLISTALVSIVLPFIKIEAFKTVISKEFIVTLPEVFLNNKLNNEPKEILRFADEVVEKIPFVVTWELFLYIGIVISALIFSYKIIKLLQLADQNPKRWKGNLLIINLVNSATAFSFFHYIFLGQQIKIEEKASILKHEMIHVKEKHTFDLLFFELLRIVFWFNPLVYMFQKRVVTLHEFITDEKAMKLTGKKAYYQNLLSQVFETKNLSFVNTFFKQSLIKKRIVMLSKTKSNKILKFKYALLIPVVFGMLLYTSCEKETILEEESVNLRELNFSVPISFKPKSFDAVSEAYKPFEENEKKMIAFLKANPNYVKWVTVNSSKTDYTIHLKSKQLPEGYKKIEGYGDEKGMFYYFGFTEGLREKMENQSVNENEEVAFAVIDEIPTYSSCEGLSNKEQKECVYKQISSHVMRNFNTDLAKSLGLKGRIKMNTIFKIDIDGNVIDIKARAEHPKLEEEIKRVIESLPKMKPGKHKGEVVTVPYALPILFQVHE